MSWIVKAGKQGKKIIKKLTAHRARADDPAHLRHDV